MPYVLLSLETPTRGALVAHRCAAISCLAAAAARLCVGEVAP